MSKEKKALSSLSLDELKTKTRELEEELFKLRLQKVTGQLTNSALLRTRRKDLARVKMYTSQKSAKPASAAAGR